MSYRYPYGNTEQMNLDWFLKQWEAFKADWAEAEAGIDGSLDAEIAKVEAAMTELYAARDAAAASATAARQSSLDAAAAQVASGNNKTAAQAAETAARGSQQAAAESAQEAQASATGAENSALTATQAANTATQQAAGADAAKGAAEAAQQAAEAAQAAAAQSAGQAGQAATAAGDHADDAADSATLAQQAAQDMSDSVEQITTNKNDISDLKESTNDLKTALSEITIPNVNTETIDIMQVATPMTDVGGYIVTATRGGYANNNGTTSCIWDITNETTFYFGTSTAPYVSCVVIENPTREWKTQSGYTAVMDGDSATRYRKSDNNLPTENNPYTTNNAIVILTITNNHTAPITITTVNGICLDLLQTTGNNKKKAMSQDAVTKALATTDKRMFIKYGAADTDVGSRGKEQITIFSPTDNGFIKFAIVRCEYENYNANNWRIDKCYACDNNLNVLFPITYDGEWEMAIQIAGAPDFIGGNAHGDEVLSEFHVLIDGIEVDDITEITEQECKEIRIVETTLLYDPSDGATLSTRTEFTPVGTHGREYIFNSDGLRLKQVVSLSTALTLGASYMTMLPILRGNDTVSQLQVTNAYIADNDYTEYDVSVGASGGAGYGWRRNVTMATIWGDDSGVSATVEMLKQPNIENSGARQFQVQDTVNAYNKLYWSICGVGGSNYTASANERFETDTLYKINHKNVS